MFEKTGRVQQAEAEYRTAIDLDPKLFFAHLHLASLLNGLGRYQEALLQSRRAIELRPNDPILLNEVAWGLAERGEKLDEALDSLRGQSGPRRKTVESSIPSVGSATSAENSRMPKSP